MQGTDAYPCLDSQPYHRNRLVRLVLSPSGRDRRFTFDHLLTFTRDSGCSVRPSLPQYQENIMSTITDSNLTATPQPRPAVGSPADVESLGIKPLPGSTGVDNTTSGMSVGSQVSVGPITTR
jgi:hypothetical protein